MVELAFDFEGKLAQCDILKKQEDRSAAFITFFLVLDILNHNPSPEIVLQAWQKVNGRLLDKLLLSGDAEAHDMTNLSLAILFAFCGYSNVADKLSFIKRSDALLAYLAQTTQFESPIDKNEGLSVVFKVLHSIASSQAGASHICTSKRLRSFASHAIQTESEKGLQWLAYCLDQGASTINNIGAEWYRELLADVIDHPWQKDAFLKAVPLILAIFFANGDQRSDKVDRKCKDLVKTALESPVKGTDYNNALLLMTLVLQKRSIRWLNLQDVKERSFAVVLGSLAATEIRSRLSELGTLDMMDAVRLSKIDEARLTSNFDLLHLLCLFLVSNVDGEIDFSPEQILRLRDDFSAAFAETMLFLREQWDRSSQSNVPAIFKNQADPETAFHASPVMTSCIGTLCFWLQEDESLHFQAAHIVDVLLSLLDGYKQNDCVLMKEVLATINLLVMLEHGRTLFITSNGWRSIENLVKESFQRRLGDVEQQANEMDVEVADLCFSLLEYVNPVKFDAWKSKQTNL